MDDKEKQELERQLVAWILGEREEQMTGKKNAVEMPLVKITNKGRLALAFMKLRNKLLP